MILSDLKIGLTNKYVHGSVLQKTIGQFLPAKGTFSIGKFALTSPERLSLNGRSNSECLTVQFHLQASSATEQSFLNPPFFRNRRLLLYGDDGFSYVEEIISGYPANFYYNCFKKYGDGVYAAMTSAVFPRDSKVFHYRLEERAFRDGDNWRELATFDLPNPHPIKPKHRDVDKSPHFKFPPDIEVEIGDLVVRTNNNKFHDIYNPWAYLSARITKNGQLITNWGITDAHCDDAVGNSALFFGSMKTVTNGWLTFATHRPLDPFTPWHFKLAFGEDSGLPTNALYSFTTAFPITGTISTNFGPYRAQISTVNGSMLSLELLDKPNDMRLDLVTATNSKGWVYRSPGAGSWGQHQFWASMYFISPDGTAHLQDTGGSPITVTIAIHPIHWAEFTLQPRYEK